MAIQITREEYEKKFGVKAPASKTATAPSGFREFVGDIRQTGAGIKQTFMDQRAKATATKEAFRTGEQGALSTGFQATGQTFGLISNIIGEGIMGLGKAVIPQKIEDVIGKKVQTKVGQIAQRPGVQNILSKYETLKETNPELARNIDAALGIGSLALDVSGIGLGAKGATIGAKQAFKGGIRAGETAIQAGKGALKTAKSVAGDIVPTASRASNYFATRALNLTQGDVKNIAKSTGHEVGEFLGEQNLIRNNVKETQEAVSNFYKENYKTVRSEISKVSKPYKAAEIPRYKDSLNALVKQINEVPGLEASADEVKTLLKKTNPTLNDVQRVKELMDEHFSLYKVTGDVKESIAKEGLANLRKDLKEFIEKEVKENTGADIADLNNKVSASRSIVDAIETRSTRGLTQSNIKIGDMGTLFAGFAINPLVGVGAVIAKKIIESPSIRLRLAKLLDKISDARKARIKAELKAGKVPNEIREIIK